jgi:predicted AlkP superfamily pyrophosphatase or phosphodiesterase
MEFSQLIGEPEAALLICTAYECRRPFVNHIEWAMKSDQIFKWLDLPIQKRPNFIAAYLPEVDQEGHHSGPVSAGVNKYLAYVDSFIKDVYDELEKRHLHDVVDIIVVSDHGMTSTHNERVIYLDRVLGEDGWQAIEHKEGWPSCGLRFKAGTDEEEMLRRLQKGAQESNGGFQVFTHQTMPEQWHFSGNPRIAPVSALLDCLVGSERRCTDLRCSGSGMGSKQSRGAFRHHEG